MSILLIGFGGFTGAVSRYLVGIFINSIGLNLGSHFNAFTGFDTTSYEIEIPTDVDQALDQGLLFLSDIIKNLDLTDESFEKERKIVEEEILSDLA